MSSYAVEVGLPQPKPPPAGAIEIVDLRSLTMVDRIPMPGREPSDLVLVGDDIYVVDPASHEVLVVTTNGTHVTSVAAPSLPEYCVLSPDQAHLYVLGAGVILIIDTATKTSRRVDIDLPRVTGIAVSDDGNHVCAVGDSVDNQGSAYLLDANSLTVRKILLRGPGGPADVAFAGSRVALVWTGSALLEIDAATGTQNPADNIGVPLPSDEPPGAFPKSLHYCAAQRRAVGISVTFSEFMNFQVPSSQIVFVDLRSRASALGPTLSLAPYLSQLAPDGHTLLLAFGHEISSPPDSLSLFDLTDGSLRGGVYGFSSSDLYVTDMQVRCVLGGIGSGPAPGSSWPLRGAGEGFWFFVDPLWDPTWGIGLTAGVGIGGALGRRLTRSLRARRRG